MNLIAFYYITQFCGLSPFKYDQSISKTFESTPLAFVSLVIGCCFCLFSILAQSYVAFAWIPARPKTVLLTVSYLEGIIVCVRNITIFFIQFKNRKKLVQFINEGFELKLELRTLCPREYIFSLEFCKNLRVKIISKTFHMILSITTVLLFCLHDKQDISHWLTAIASILVYVYPLIITSIYYCGSVMISTRFYEILNSKISSLLTYTHKNTNLNQCSRKQVFCDISDNIDYVSVLYNRITYFVESINNYLSLQVVIAQFASFVLAISSVNFCNLNSLVINLKLS